MSREAKIRFNDDDDDDDADQVERMARFVRDSRDRGMSRRDAGHPPPASLFSTPVDRRIKEDALVDAIRDLKHRPPPSLLPSPRPRRSAETFTERRRERERKEARA